jgi:hypothetical protein
MLDALEEVLTQQPTTFLGDAALLEYLAQPDHGQDPENNTSGGDRMGGRYRGCGHEASRHSCGDDAEPAPGEIMTGRAQDAALLRLVDEYIEADKKWRGINRAETAVPRRLQFALERKSAAALKVVDRLPDKIERTLHGAEPACFEPGFGVPLLRGGKVFRLRGGDRA